MGVAPMMLVLIMVVLVSETKGADVLSPAAGKMINILTRRGEIRLFMLC